MQMQSFTRLGAALLAAILLSACGGGGGDDDKDFVDDIIDSQLDFSGVFEDEDGLVIELDGDTATVRAFGSSPFGTTGTFSVGDDYMIGMAEQEPGVYRGYVAYLNNFIEDDPTSKVVLYDWATVNIEDGVLSFTDPAGEERDFAWIAADWQTDEPTDPTDSGGDTGGGDDSDGDSGEPGGGSSVSVIEKNDLDGDEGSSRIFTITVPSGMSRLEVVLSEGEWGYQVADMFVSRGSQPSASKYPYTWSADCASVNPNRQRETCSFNNPASGTWHILVYGYHAYYGANLTITLTP